MTISISKSGKVLISATSICTYGLFTVKQARIRPELAEFFSRDPEIATIFKVIFDILIIVYVD